MNMVHNVMCILCTILLGVSLYLLDWWITKATRSNVVTRNYMQTNMPGNYVI